MDSRQRAHFINGLSGFKSANLIGTADENGATNLAMFSSVTHLGADPALVGFIVRPDTVARHTLDNIKQQNRYTINQVHKSFWQAAHQTSARYDKEQCEFAMTGLTKEYVAGFNPPFVQQSRLKYGLSLIECLPIKHNGTILVIGEIEIVLIDPKAVKDDGFVDIEALDTVTVSGLDSYHDTNRLSRLSYAKPNLRVTKIPLNGASSRKL